MHQPHHPNPLHGVKLETIVTALVHCYGRERLGDMIRINCFRMNPSIKSSLTFLRKTERARKEVEELYLWSREQGKITAPPQSPLVTQNN